MTTPAAPKFAPPRREQPCPCGAGPAFGACCEPILLQQKPAADAAQLMRSRFTAHVARDYAHLHRSYLGTSREPYVATGEEATTAWTRLVIHAHETGPKPDFATVDFTAYYKENDTEQALHEKGEFQKIEGTWYYARAIRQGPAPIISGQAKVGRNEPCPCGSGKKYKQCCLRKA